MSANGKKPWWAALLAMALFAGYAHGLQYNSERDFLWEVSGDGVIITGFTGHGTAVRIPPQIRGMPVTGIGVGAFAGRELVGVVIPDGVTHIGNSAFFGNRIVGVAIPDTVTRIGNNAFANNRLTGVVIPDGVTGIGNMAFANNRLAEVVVGNGVVSIGEWAFAFNPLTGIVIGNGIDTLHENAFTGSLGNLSRISVGAGVNLYGSHCVWAGFRYAYRANDRAAGTYVYDTGEWRFFPGPAYVFDQRQYDGEEDFRWEVSENGVVITGYLGRNTEVRIPSLIRGMPVTEIGAAAFQGSGFTGAVIPRSVTSIGYAAFLGNQLAGVTIGDNVTTIGDWAFAMNRLVCVTIPDGVEEIGSHAFRENLLSGVTIPDSVSYIGSWAFARNSLAGIVIGGGVTGIGHAAFSDNLLYDVTIPGNVAFIDWGAFQGNQLFSITIGDGVEIEAGGGFPFGFDLFYREQERRAGTYSINGRWSVEFR